MTKQNKKEEIVVSKFKIGDEVKNSKGSALIFRGIITNIVRGGKNLGFPWKDNTLHYEVIDKKTGIVMVVHPNALVKR